MKLHRNARTCPRSRRLLVERIETQGWPRAQTAAGAGISERTAVKWLPRWRAEGEAGLFDRCSAPHRIPHRTPERRRRLVLALAYGCGRRRRAQAYVARAARSLLRASGRRDLRHETSSSRCDESRRAASERPPISSLQFRQRPHPAHIPREVARTNRLTEPASADVVSRDGAGWSPVVATSATARKWLRP